MYSISLFLLPPLPSRPTSWGVPSCQKTPASLRHASWGIQPWSIGFVVTDIVFVCMKCATQIQNVSSCLTWITLSVRVSQQWHCIRVCQPELSLFNLWMRLAQLSSRITSWSLCVYYQQLTNLACSVNCHFHFHIPDQCDPLQALTFLWTLSPDVPPLRVWLPHRSEFIPLEAASSPAFCAVLNTSVNMQGLTGTQQTSPTVHKGKNKALQYNITTTSFYRDTDIH